ncbi:MAG: hypothetical protein ACXACO_02345 [Promethearchaeota archaeon]
MVERSLDDMTDIDKLDKKFRNSSIILLLVASILLVIWIVSYLRSQENASPILLAISISLLLAGILLFTRIQYIIWVKNRYN